jgi:hypothetical protein
MSELGELCLASRDQIAIPDSAGNFALNTLSMSRIKEYSLSRNYFRSFNKIQQ